MGVEADVDGLRRNLRNIWSDHLREHDGDHVCADSTCAATQTVFNAKGQQYRQKTSFAYLRGAVTETPNLSAETDQRIRLG